MTEVILSISGCPLVCLHCLHVNTTLVYFLFPFFCCCCFYCFQGFFPSSFCPPCRNICTRIQITTGVLWSSGGSPRGRLPNPEKHLKIICHQCCLAGSVERKERLGSAEGQLVPRQFALAPQKIVRNASSLASFQIPESQTLKVGSSSCPDDPCALQDGIHWCKRRTEGKCWD